MTVITVDGEVDESTLTWKLWREDQGQCWAIIHELHDASGRVVRRDTWVNFKGVPVPAGSIEQGRM